jgi:hypothetical protein
MDHPDSKLNQAIEARAAAGRIRGEPESFAAKVVRNAK